MVNSENLTLHQPYLGNETVAVENDSGLGITYYFFEIFLGNIL
jgi:hypothetical protein